MKKFISFLLIMTVLLTAIPATLALADIKPNNTTLELKEGDTFSLQTANITRSNDIVIWSTTNKNVATVTADGVVTAVKIGKAKITAKIDTKKIVYKVTVKKNIAEIRPSDAYTFISSDIIGSGFYVIQNYIYNGSSSYGEDFETTLKNLDEDMLKLSEYNDGISKFDGEEYDDLKLAWNNLYTEINKLYDLLKTNPPKINDKNYVFDLKTIKKCLEGYSKECMYFN
jgi:hypothetical protein